MLDQVHTNEQRIYKIRASLTAVRELAHTLELAHGKADPLVSTLLSLADDVTEAEGSLDAIEKFLSERNALEGIE